MKVLTAAEMREVDRRTMDLGISGPILMENAGLRVVEFLVERFAPLDSHRILILCGRGNNGGDGLVVARQLWTRFRPAALHVVLADPGEESEPLRMLRAAGLEPQTQLRQEMQAATIVIDALLGTGVTGAARGRALELIRAINTGFPLAKVVAVDIPSGLPSDGKEPEGEFARAHATVTFTAPKVSHAVQPNCDRMGELRVVPIGSPATLFEQIPLHLSEPEDFADLLLPRQRESNKGRYGHVLVIGGAEGKAGAAEMTGLAALRAGAGLVTVACSAPALHTLELMTACLPSDDAALEALARGKNVLAVGPGLGTDEAAQGIVEGALECCPGILVLDADALNVLARSDWQHEAKCCVITPHPGEMSRLSGATVAEVQANRLAAAREYAAEHNAIVVLKGHRSVIAMPDGRAWINPTGSPALSTGGTGDILTGLIAGFAAQFPDDAEAAVIAAVYLHGRAGELAGAALGEKSVIARDLLAHLPEAIRAASV